MCERDIGCDLISFIAASFDIGRNFGPTPLINFNLLFEIVFVIGKIL